MNSVRFLRSCSIQVRSNRRVVVTLVTTLLGFLTLGTFGAGEEGAYQGPCRTNWIANGENPPLACVDTCDPQEECAQNSDTQTDGSVWHWCSCTPGYVPTCCHLVIVMNEGQHEDNLYLGKCAQDGCPGAANTTCQRAPVAVPFGQPGRVKAVCASSQ